MKKFVQDQINPELPGIVLLSHGGLAVGLVDTVSMLLGEPENLAAFSLEPGDDIDEYRASFSAAYESFPEGSVIMADLYGGTPFNQTVRYVLETGKPVELVVGLSLPMLIESIGNRDCMRAGELADLAVESAKVSTMHVDTNEFLADDEEEDDD